MRVFNYFVNKVKMYTFSNNNNNIINDNYTNNRSNNNLLIIGREQVGKSAWIRNFVMQENQNMVVRVRSHDNKWMERLISSIVGYNGKNQQQKQQQRVNNSNNNNYSNRNNSQRRSSPTPNRSSSLVTPSLLTSNPNQQQ